MGATEIRAKAVALTKAQKTEQLVQAFALSDAMSMTDPGVTTARGFIIDELAVRGQLHLIGISDEDGSVI